MQTGNKAMQGRASPSTQKQDLCNAFQILFLNSRVQQVKSGKMPSFGTCDIYDLKLIYISNRIHSTRAVDLPYENLEEFEKASLSNELNTCTVFLLHSVSFWLHTRGFLCNMYTRGFITVCFS